MNKNVKCLYIVFIPCFILSLLIKYFRLIPFKTFQSELESSRFFLLILSIRKVTFTGTFVLCKLFRDGVKRWLKRVGRRWSLEIKDVNHREKVRNSINWKDVTHCGASYWNCTQIILYMILYMIHTLILSFYFHETRN